MAVSISSKEKVKYSKNLGETIESSSSKLDKTIDSLRDFANSCKLQAVDNIYNAYCDIAGVLVDGFKVAKECGVNITTAVIKNPLIDANVKADAKKTEAELEGVKLPSEFSRITVERDGSESWNPTKFDELNTLMDSVSNVRKEYIIQLAEAKKYAGDDEDFRQLHMTLGKKSEEMTNSIARVYASIKQEITDLDVRLDKTMSNLASDVTTSTAKIGSATVKSISPENDFM